MGMFSSVLGPARYDGLLGAHTHSVDNNAWSGTYTQVSFGSGQANAKPSALTDMGASELLTMLAVRLRYPAGLLLPADYITAYAVSAERVVVFVVKDGQHVTLEDDALYPSDTLVAQLRLILGI